MSNFLVAMAATLIILGCLFCAAFLIVKGHQWWAPVFLFLALVLRLDYGARIRGRERDEANDNVHQIR